MKRAIIAIAAVGLILAGSAGIAVGKVVYVDGDAGGANNGTCWADAYMFVQDALTDANESEKPVEVWVAQGIYRPDRTAVEPNGTGDRMATFLLIDGVTIQGGYAGFGQPDPNAREIELYETILSGDLKGDDADVANLEDLLWEVTRSDNSQRVVEAWDTDGSAGIEGFTVTAGNNRSVCKSGPCAGAGGLRNLRASPTIERCTFTANAAGAGGGICNYEESNPSIIDCILTGNYAADGGAIYGGATFVQCCSFLGNCGFRGGAISSCDGLISECKFTGNSAQYGGAIAGGDASIVHCVFSSNSADEQGGAVLSACSDTLMLNNCILNDNSGGSLGGAMLIVCDAVVTITNCTLSGNFATTARGVACYDWDQIGDPSHLTIRNCILFDGGDEIWANYNSTIIVTHSNVEDGYEGEGNVDADPCFADEGNDDYHLKSQGGRWDLSSQSWVIDETTSPCIDAGGVFDHVGLEQFPSGGIINMGAYGGTVEASKSYFGRAPCETIVAGDVNGDCMIDFLDFRLMALHWLEEH